jgi:hypothetical protein
MASHTFLEQRQHNLLRRHFERKQRNPAAIKSALKMPNNLPHAAKTHAQTWFSRIICPCNDDDFFIVHLFEHHLQSSPP